MVENNSNTESIQQELLNKLKTIAEAKTELETKIAEEIKSKSRNNNGILVDSDSQCPIISYEKAKKMGFKIDKSSSKNTDRTISRICRHILNKKINISFSKLLKIVKPEIQQDIIKTVNTSSSPCRKRYISNSRKSNESVDVGFTSNSLLQGLCRNACWAIVIACPKLLASCETTAYTAPILRKYRGSNP
nr:12377_t:CDS:2 [Entrophospora candida]